MTKVYQLGQEYLKGQLFTSSFSYRPYAIDVDNAFEFSKQHFRSCLTQTATIIVVKT